MSTARGDPQPVDVARICHRANNDLQTLLNILGLLASRVATAQELVTEAAPRIAAIGAVYAVIKATTALPTLEALGQELARRTQARHPLGPEVVIQLPREEVELKVASGLGLWLGEVLEAGCRGWAGTGEVAVRGVVSKGYLHIRAQGTGSLEGWTGQEGLGLAMARGLAEMQLGGEMKLSQEHGLWEVELIMHWPP